MKAYKRQKMAMFAILVAASMSSTAFASSTQSIHPNDITNKPFVTKMHKNLILDNSKDPMAKVGKKSSKKHAKKKTQSPRKVRI